MDREVTSMPEAKKIERKTFLKGAAATAAAVAGAGTVAGIAKAAPRVEVISSAPSGEALIWVNTNLFNAGQVAAFNKVYPNVKITQKATLYVPGTPSLSSHLVTGVDVPDGIFFMEDAYLGQFAPNLYDVTKYVAPYASKIAPYKLAVSKQLGKTVGIPWDVDPAFLIYNKTITDAAGVDVSKIVTRDDLIQAALTVRVESAHVQVLRSASAPIRPTCSSSSKAWPGSSTPASWTPRATSTSWRRNTPTPSTTWRRRQEQAGDHATSSPRLPSTTRGTRAVCCFTVFADWFTHWNEPGMKPLWGKIGLAKQPVFDTGQGQPVLHDGWLSLRGAAQGQEPGSGRPVRHLPALRAGRAAGRQRLQHLRRHPSVCRGTLAGRQPECLPAQDDHQPLYRRAQLAGHGCGWAHPRTTAIRRGTRRRSPTMPRRY